MHYFIGGKHLDGGFTCSKTRLLERSIMSVTFAQPRKLLEAEEPGIIVGE
jgi:hypothetical protein